MKPERGWRRHFDDPITLPDGRQFVTREDAGNYITKLPKAEHTTAKWQAAMKALILVATSGGPTMSARIGIMRALKRHVEREFNPARKDQSWRKRKLARDEYTNKLLKLQSELLQTLDRRRRGNSQSIVVKHVHIHPGGWSEL